MTLKSLSSSLFAGPNPNRQVSFLIAAAFVCLVSLPCVAQQSVSITQKWTGKIADPSLRGAADRIVRDAETWNKLWASWRPGKKVVDVDWSNQIVLVETVDGPNNILTSSPKIDATGELKYEIAGTKMAGAGFGYLLMSVPAAKIKRVNGESVLGRPGPDTVLGSDEAKPMPVKVTPVVDPNRSVKRERTPQPVESIKVDITGVVRTGMNSIGGETTGNLIAANGIIWELELTPQQVIAVGKIGNSMVTVRGSLRKTRGVEVRDRYIVTVDGLVQAGTAAGLSADRVIRPSRQTDAGSNRRSGNDLVRMPAEDRAKNAVGKTSDLTSFESITIKITGGLTGKEQRQTVSPKGKVNYEFKSQNVTNNWQIEAEKLALLHQLIDDTDWGTVPPVTRSVARPDAYNYEILISTEDGKRRFFIDGPSVAKQPVITQLFGLLRRPNR